MGRTALVVRGGIGLESGDVSQINILVVLQEVCFGFDKESLRQEGLVEPELSRRLQELVAQSCNLLSDEVTIIIIKLSSHRSRELLIQRGTDTTH